MQLNMVCGMLLNHMGDICFVCRDQVQWSRAQLITMPWKEERGPVKHATVHNFYCGVKNTITEKGNLT